MKKTIYSILTVLILIFLICSTLCAFAVSPSEARNSAIGSTVTVNGYAFSATDNNNSGFSDEFYLSDTAAKGICVTLSKGEKVSLYKEYSVTGTLQSVNGELKLQASQVSTLSGSTTRKFKRLSITEAQSYEQNGGTFIRLSGEASEPVIHGDYLSSFTLTKDGKQIRVIIENNITSSTNGISGKAELTESLRYKREVTVDGFVAKIGSETVIRIKDCDDIDVQHHNCVFGEAFTEKTPSCTVDGLSVKLCNCGMREETVISATGHNIYEETERKSTCALEGIKAEKCRNCDYRKETQLTKLDHSFAEKTEVAATCYSEGVYVRYCKNCTLREETSIPKTEHSYRERTEIEPSCSSEGLRVRYCYYCTFREESAIPKTAHSYAEKTETPATCYSEGVYVRYCKNCTLREETSIPKTEHSYRERTEIEPSCSNEGLRVRYCYYCTFREESAIPKTAHSYAEKTETPATCYSEGVYVRYCKNCTLREETALSKTEHKLKEKTEKEPTCTESGLKVTYCSSCTYKIETALPQTSHSFAEKTETPATCSTEGVYVKYCRTCTFREETLIAKTEHKLKERTEKEPTCTESGLKVTYCSSCTYKTETEIAEKGHSYETKIKKATFTEDGNQTEFCNSCDDIKSTTVISAVNSVKLSAESFVYDGKLHSPSVTLTDKDGKNITDFTLSCESRKAIGKHSLTVELNGNYSGKKTLYFTIIPRDVSDIKTETTSKSVTLTFKGSTGADGYRIYYNNSGKNESLGTFSAESCTVTLPKHGETYTLTVKAYTKADDTTLWSEGITVVVPTGPDVVTGIIAESTFSSVKLSWNKTETADGYRVYVKTENGKFKTLTTTTKNTFTINGLSPDKSYTYSVKAYRKADGKTIWGAATRKAVTTPSGKPASFSGKVSFTEVQLSWREVKGADGYKIYIYNSKKKKYVTLKAVKDNSLIAEDLKSGTTYKFALKAYSKADGKTIYGKPVYLTVTTKLEKPVITAKITSKGNKISWNKVNGADGYVIYYSNNKDGSYKKLKAIKDTSYIHTNTAKSKSYYYKVRAYKSVNGEKIYSSFSTTKKAKL